MDHKARNLAVWADSFEGFLEIVFGEFGIPTLFTLGQLAQTGYIWHCGDINRVRVYPSW